MFMVLRASGETAADGGGNQRRAITASDGRGRVAVAPRRRDEGKSAPGERREPFRGVNDFALHHYAWQGRTHGQRALDVAA